MTTQTKTRQCLGCGRTVERAEPGSTVWLDTRGRPRCDGGPAHFIDNPIVRSIVNAIHVAATPRSVIERVRRSFREDVRNDPTLRDARKAAYRAALVYHERNGAEYRWVMGPH